MNKIKIPKNWVFKYFEVEGNTTKFVYEDQLGIEHINIDEKPELPTYEELQERIDKAIEYIEKYCIDGVENEYNTPQTVFEENGIEKDNARIELLNILKGRK